ncbi:MAG: thiamine phosphate synthase [Terriglobales bacterium]
MVRCYITDRTALPAPNAGSVAALLAQIAAVGHAGIELIQLREKDLDGRALYQLAVAARERLASSPGQLLINDRLDIALAAGAAGVHLPAAGLPVAEVRRHAPAGFIITQSCHSPAEVAAAARAGADWCVLAPIFSTPSKPGVAPLGVEAIRAAAGQGRVLALGGISAETISRCLEAGAAGIAGIRYFQSTHPAKP